MQKPTLTRLNERAREAILRGVNAVYEPVKLTLGPEGGNALMYRTFNRGPRITNDGVTIAEVIEPKDEFEQLAAHAFREAAKRTNEKAGDGTTTTIVIGGKLLNDVFTQLSDQVSTIRTKTAGGKTGVMKLRREILAQAEKVQEEIKKRSTPIETLEDLIKVATVSVEDKELGKTIAEMVYKIGVQGYVDVVEGHKGCVETEVIEGMRFPAKVAAKAFVNNPARYEMVIEDCPVIVTNHAIDNAAQVGSFTKHLNTTKLAIIAPSFSENALVHFVAAFKNGFHIFPVLAPSLRTEQLEDVSSYIGCTFVDKAKGRKMENIRDADLGFIHKIVVKDIDAKEDAIAIGGEGAETDAVKNRIEVLKKQREETKDEIYRKMIDRRIASMASAVGVIRVGATSQAEGLYLKLKIEDAVYACRAALEEGYVKGGGLCLKEIAEQGDYGILTEAIKAPYEQIQANAEEPIVITDDIIDPAKSVRLAVENAVSVVAHLATVKIIIPEMRDKEPGEGYTDIARAIHRYASLFAQKEKLLKEGMDESDTDTERYYERELLKDR